MEHKPENERAPRLFLNDGDRADLDAWLREHGLQSSPLVLLQPGNKRTLKRGRAGQWTDDKAWADLNWQRLIQKILTRDPDLRVILCGVPAERNVLRAIAAGSDPERVLDAHGELPLRRLLALLERACAMISVDTGPAHAAAAMGCPLIVMYGSSSPLQWLPRSPSGSPVIGLGGPPLRSRVSEITLEEVLAAWNTLPLRHFPT